MRVVLAIRTRDQADLVDAFLAYHLSAGVDFVIATDHRSSDGTDAVIQRYEREGYARLIRDDDERITLRRSEMARLAAIEHGADWVLHADGDEVWWPRGGTIAEVLGTIPERYGIVRGAWHHFAPRPEDGRHSLERLTVRIRPPGPHTRQSDPFHPQVKVAHRSHPAVVVTQGGHDAEAEGLGTLRSWYPFEVLHFPLRSMEQGRVKYEQLHGGLTGTGLDVSRHVERAHAAIARGGWEDIYRRWLVGDAELPRRAVAGTLAEDTRLRDALRTLAGVDELAPAGQSYRVNTNAGLFTKSPSLVESATFACDTQALHDLDAASRLLERVDELERRTAAIGG